MEEPNLYALHLIKCGRYPMKKTCGAKKMQKVLKEFQQGKLHSGSKKGPVVRKKKQAVAIGISEAKTSCGRKK